MVTYCKCFPIPWPQSDSPCTLVIISITYKPGGWRIRSLSQNPASGLVYPHAFGVQYNMWGHTVGGVEGSVILCVIVIPLASTL